MSDEVYVGPFREALVTLVERDVYELNQQGKGRLDKIGGAGVRRGVREERYAYELNQQGWGNWTRQAELVSDEASVRRIISCQLQRIYKLH